MVVIALAVVPILFVMIIASTSTTSTSFLGSAGHWQQVAATSSIIVRSILVSCGYGDGDMQ